MPLHNRTARKPSTRWGGATAKEAGGLVAWFWRDRKRITQYCADETAVVALKEQIEAEAEAAPVPAQWGADLRRLADDFDARKPESWNRTLTALQRLLMEALAKRDMDGVLIIEETIAATHKCCQAARSLVDLTKIDRRMTVLERQVAEAEAAEIEHTGPAQADRQIDGAAGT